MVANTLDTARQLFAQYGDATWLLETSGAHTGPAIYVCDVASRRTLILRTAADALQRLAAVELSEADYLRIRSATSVLLDDLLSSTEGIHPDTRRGVIFGVAFCITTTRGFHITKHHGADVQHLLLRYPDVSQRDHVLTPMPMFKPHPISNTELDATATHVLLSEHLNYPERFAGGKPLRFTEARRNVLAGVSKS